MPAEQEAIALDQSDPLGMYRDQFHLPTLPDGTPWIYFVGNSLGLMPKGARDTVLQELDDWARLGVEGHFHGKTPWFSYHEVFRETGARLVGARPGEVVMMNSLTVNLHLMLATFYQPVAGRSIILTEDCAFPSDTYALETHIRHRGFDPSTSLIVIRPRDGETLLRTGDIVELIEQRGKEIALVMLSGVNYYTGQLFDLERIAAAAKRQGCAVGFDLAHAVGNAELRLHDWNADFAIWCSYKYLNGGPGAVAGCFVHARHANTTRPRFAGWWGHDQASRFRMEGNFVPTPGADGWQLSNPPILGLAPLRASLDLFASAGMDKLRARSLELTAYLEQLIRARLSDTLQIVTPRESERRGAQLSLRVLQGRGLSGRAAGRDLFEYLATRGVVGDWREPDVIRISPAPLYNTRSDILRFATEVARWRDR